MAKRNSTKNCIGCSKEFAIKHGLYKVRHCSMECYNKARTKPVHERFWSKVDKSGECWIWTGVRQNGYGSFWFEHGPKPAHRISWTLTHGPITDGLFACHRCDNPACVNPDHLFLGTAGDNARDMWSKGRQAIRVRGKCIKRPLPSAENLAPISCPLDPR